MKESLYRATIVITMLFNGCGGETKIMPEEPSVQPVVHRPESADGNPTILFLEVRISSDAEDYIALNKLASEYLQQMRLTGDDRYLQLALNMAKASLAVLPAEQNKGGLAALARAQFSSHDFAGSHGNAIRLTEIDPGNGYVYQLLGDALYELGKYDDAKAAFKKMDELIEANGLARVGVEQRLARMAMLYGDSAKAKIHMEKALRIAELPPRTSPETVAWCQWQLGEMAFAQGDFRSAEKLFNLALVTLPGYFAAVEALGHLRAALGDLPGAIESYEKAKGPTPGPATTAMLGDLYWLAGRETDAEREYALFSEIERINAAKGNIYSRDLLMFYANHDIKTGEACDSAIREYETRKDIYGADLVAWTCLKAGRLEEARPAIRDALRLGTKDAKLFYHAGMIEKELGNQNEARRFLKLSLETNPAFDPLQAEKARNILAAMQ